MLETAVRDARHCKSPLAPGSAVGGCSPDLNCAGWLNRAGCDGAYPPPARRVPVTFATDAAALMMAYRWPGNVRELRNVVETTVALAESGLIEADDLPDEVRTVTPGQEQQPPVAGDLREAERQAILAQVRACDGNLTQAARRLGIARSTLYLRLAKYGGGPALTS